MVNFERSPALSIARCCSLFVAAMATLMIFSWLTHWTTPLTFFPKSPPLVFNSALCFLLLTLGDLLRKYDLARRAWIVVLIVSLMSCLQYLFEIDLGIDEIFVSGYPWLYLSHPGRMPPPSAFSFVLAALAQGTFFQQKPNSTFPWGLLSVICSALVGFLGTAGAVYYLASVSKNVFWGNFAKMAFPAAVGLILLGAQGLLCCTQKIELKKGNRWGVAGVLCGVGVFLITFVTWEMRLIENTATTSAQIKTQIESRAQSLTLDLQSMAERFQKMHIPASHKETKAQNWSPQLSGAHVVIHLGSRLEAIWSEQLVSEKDLRLLQTQMQPTENFVFFPSLLFQRSRWMGFLNKSTLVIFSPEILILKHFPDQKFLYSLHSNDDILFSNATNLPMVLQDWNMMVPMHLWNSELVMHLNPTRETLAEVGSSSFLPYLLAGMSLSLALGVIFSSIPRIRARFSH